MMAWFWLILGGLFEVGFTTSLRFVDGFRNLPLDARLPGLGGDQHGAARICRANHPDGHRLCGVGRDRRGRHGDRRHRPGFNEPATVRMLLILGIVGCIAALKLTA